MSVCSTLEFIRLVAPEARVEISSSTLQTFTANLLPYVLYLPLPFECNYHKHWHNTLQSIMLNNQVITAFYYDNYCQLTVTNVTLSKAVMSTVEIFAVCIYQIILNIIFIQAFSDKLINFELF